MTMESNEEAMIKTFSTPKTLRQTTTTSYLLLKTQVISTDFTVAHDSGSSSLAFSRTLSLVSKFRPGIGSFEPQYSASSQNIDLLSTSMDSFRELSKWSGHPQVY